jgi:carboxymethylenebutenolidase
MTSPIDLSPRSAPTGGSRRLTGYLSRPDGPGPWPGVVVVHEMFGVEANMRRHAERLARAGYLTLMPNLYTDGGIRRCLVSTMRAATSGQGPAYQDIAAARAALAEAPDCTGRIGIIGFCMGGAFALMTAGSGDYDAVSANYGRLPEDPDKVLVGACPVVGSYGRRDPVVGKGAAAKLETALDRLGVIHDVKEYPEPAGHAFLNDAQFGPRVLQPLFRVTGFGPDPEASADAWRRIEAFFATHLNPQPAP